MIISAEYYQVVYLFIVTLLSIFVLQKYSQRVLNKENRTKTDEWLIALLVCVFMIYFIGTRPVSGRYFVDMAGYNENYSVILGQYFIFDNTAENLFFDNWFAWMASKYIDITVVFIIFASVYFGMMLIACRKLFPKDTLLAFIVCLAAFSTFSYGTNGMKAGMAASTFLVALAFYEKWWLSIPIALFTFGQHHSMVLVIASYFLVLLVKNPKYYFWGWLASFFIAALHITAFQVFFAGFTDEQGARYLLSERNSGFRIDFILYSAVPTVTGYLIVFKYRLLRSRTYNVLLNLYLTTNAFWMLCMYSDFTNRISYLSWFLYPIVLLYPFVNLKWHQKQAMFLKYVVYGHLGFTLFMSIIYYG